jgi:hypothetical protein
MNAPPLAAPIQSHKQRSGITYGRFECAPALSTFPAKVRVLPYGAGPIAYNILYPAYNIQRDFFWPRRENQSALKDGFGQRFCRPTR